MYFILVFINILFSLGLTIQMWFQKSRGLPVKPFQRVSSQGSLRSRSSSNESLKNEHMKKSSGSSTSIAGSSGSGGHHQLRKVEADRKSLKQEAKVLKGRLEQEKEMRHRLASRLQEERLLRGDLFNRLQDVEKEREYLRMMLTMLVDNTGAIEQLVSQLNLCKRDFDDFAPPKPTKYGRVSMEPYDAVSVCSERKSQDSYLTTIQSIDSVTTDDFHDSRRSKSDIYNSFEIREFDSASPIH